VPWDEDDEYVLDDASGVEAPVLHLECSGYDKSTFVQCTVIKIRLGSSKLAASHRCGVK